MRGVRELDAGQHGADHVDGNRSVGRQRGVGAQRGRQGRGRPWVLRGELDVEQRAPVRTGRDRPVREHPGVGQPGTDQRGLEQGTLVVLLVEVRDEVH